MHREEGNVASVQPPALSFLGNAAIENGGANSRIRASAETSNQVVGCLVNGLNKGNVSSAFFW